MALHGEQENAGQVQPETKLIRLASSKSFWMTMLIRLIIIGSLAIVFSFGPQLKEGTSSACGALAAKAYDKVLPGQVNDPISGRKFAAATGGFLLEEKFANDFPQWPTFGVCSALYWRTIIEQTSTQSN